jgi:iron complex outermembrane receptor protein
VNRRTEYTRLKLATSLILASFALSVILPAQALAQTSPPENEAAASPTITSETGAVAAPNSDEVVVTGSRLGVRGFTAPTPVTVLGTDMIEKRAAPNIGEALAQLPSFRATSTPATQQIFPANAGARIADLRGLGASRTLVLVDSRRFTPSTSSGTVDLNLIPTPLIQRAEIVTGGASAAYGSDAVSGVINILLNTRLQGGKATAGYGVSDKGDGKQYFAQFAAGTSFGGGRGHVVFGGEYNKDEGTGGCYTRTFCSNEVGDLTGTPGAGGRPAHNISYQVRTSTLTPGGLITATTNAAGVRTPAQGGPLSGIQFDAAGQPTSFTYGQFPSALFQQGGTGAGLNGFFGDPLLSIPVERYNALGHFEYEFSPAFTGFVEASYGHVTGKTRGPEIRDLGFPTAGTVVRNDNPFLPASIKQIMAANGIVSLTLGKLGADFGTVDSVVSRDTMRVVAGGSGELGGTWKWDGYAQYGVTDYKQTSINNRITARYAKAVDALAGPGRQAICRVNADSNPLNDDPACVALNFLGQGNFSPAAKNYAFGTSSQSSIFSQTAGAFNVRGQPLETWAGPVAFATGIEARENRLNIQVDPISATNGFYVFNQTPSQGQVRVVEGYVEVAVPLLRDSPLGSSLDVNGAVRRAQYTNTSGSTKSKFNATTWKLGVTYRPIDWVLLRATKSRDVRAPNTSELFTTPVGGQAALVDTKTSSQVFAQTLTGGNINLRPERASTLTAGFTLQPRGILRGFRFSADYYDIVIKDAIATLGAQVIVDTCNARNTPDLCALVGRDSNGILQKVSVLFLNLNRQKVRGLDLEAGYTRSLGENRSLDLRVLANHAIHVTNSALPGVDRAGDDGPSGVPSWVVDADASLNWGRVGVNLQGRYIAAGKYDATLIGPQDAGYSITLPNSINNNRVPSRFMTNLGVTFDLISRGKDKVELFANVYNLFNVLAPPLWNGNNNGVYYDNIGRRYRMGVRASF